jgi:hypothetical protein
MTGIDTYNTCDKCGMCGTTVSLLYMHFMGGGVSPTTPGAVSAELMTSYEKSHDK